MPIPLGVDRRIAHHPVQSHPVATGRSGQIETYLASQVQNPTITLIGTVVTPVSETAELSLSIGTPTPVSETAQLSLSFTTSVA